MSETEIAIPPALAVDEWAALQMPANGTVPADDHCSARIDGRNVRLMSDENERTTVPPSQRHGLAALCLYGQPFGFTRDDLDTLRGLEELTFCEGYGPETRSLIARIAALLPPE